MAGRPTNYNEEIGQKAKDYLSNDESLNYKSLGHAIPSVVGLCRVLNRAKSTLYLWAEDKDHPFSDTLRECAEFQEFSALNGGLDSTLNAQTVKLVLANLGYHDKQDQTLSGPGGNPIEVDQQWQVEFVNATTDGDS